MKYTVKVKLSYDVLSGGNGNVFVNCYARLGDVYGSGTGRTEEEARERALKEIVNIVERLGGLKKPNDEEVIIDVNI